jgi:ADP-ribose pyrophosphatase YjhB (NUDIX family)
VKSSDQLNFVKRIQALSDTGLVYAENEYDRERYEELKEISLKLLATMADRPLSALQNFYMPVIDYPTPKVDVRGFVLNDAKEVLMVKESEDDKWTIPGGWADVGYSPSEVVVKEIEEETGFKTDVVRLLAIYDKKCHPHPPQPFYIYKLNFLCRICGGKLKPSFDIKDVGFFPIDKLPELSEDRILQRQLEQLYKMVIDDDQVVYFD